VGTPIPAKGYWEVVFKANVADDIIDNFEYVKSDIGEPDVSLSPSKDTIRFAFYIGNNYRYFTQIAGVVTDINEDFIVSQFSVFGDVNNTRTNFISAFAFDALGVGSAVNASFRIYPPLPE